MIVAVACAALASRAEADTVKLVPQMSRGEARGRASEDGRYSIRWLLTSAVGLWDHVAGIYLGEVARPPDTNPECALSPDGRYLAYDGGSWIVIQDLDTGAIRRIGPMPSTLTDVWFSRDGAHVFAAHAKGQPGALSDHAISMWKFAEGTKVSEVPTWVPVKQAFLAHDDVSLGSSPDELYWPTYADQIQRLDMRSGVVAERISIPEPLRGRIKLAVSADGKRAVTRHIRKVGAGQDLDGVLVYWDWPQRKVIRTVQLFHPRQPWMSPSSAQLAISPNGDYVVVRIPKKEVRLYRFGEVDFLFAVPGEPDVFAFTADSKRVAIGGGLRTAATGRLVMPEMPEPSSFSVRVAMHGDVAFVARGNDVSAWDLQALERRWVRHDKFSHRSEDAVVSSDGTKLTVDFETENTSASTLATRTRTFDVTTGALVAEGQRPGKMRPDNLADRVESPDGQWVISIAEKSRTAELRKLEPLKNGKDPGPVVRTFQLAQPPGVAETVFRWTKHGFVSSTAGTLQFWTVTRSTPVATHVIGTESWAALKVALSPDTNTVAAAYVGTTLQLFDAATGARVRSSSLDKLGYVWKLAIGNDRTWATVVIDSTPMAINLVRDASVRLFEDEHQWAIVDGDGVFTASAGAGTLLAAVRGRRGFRIDQLALRNNDPARLMRALGVGTEEQRVYYEHAYRARLRRAGVDGATIGDMFESIPTVEFASATQDGDHVDLALDLDAPRGLLRYNIDVNGVPVFGSQGKPVSGKHQRVTERIQLGRNTNRVELRVTDSSGIDGLRPVRQFELASTGKSELYFLGFGVSDYANPAYRLAFARKDALDLAAVLQHAGSAFARVHTRVYVDAAVTPDQIRAAKQFVAKAGVDDVVIVMIAGHGIHASDKAAQYYFVTHGTDIARLAQTAAPFEDIESLVDGIGSRRKLFLMDTCESGERDPKDEIAATTRAGGRGLSSRGLARVAATGSSAPRRFVLERDNFLFNGILRSSGTVVFSSSRGAELSYETEELRNGVFTQAVLEALTEDTADVNGDGQITTTELRTYVAKDVADYTEGAQNPTIDRDNLAADIAIPKLSGGRAIVGRADAPQPDYVVAGGMRPVAPATVLKPARSARGCGCESGHAGSGLLGLAILAWMTRRRRPA